MPSFLKALLKNTDKDKDDFCVVSSIKEPDEVVDHTSADRVLAAAEVDAARLWELKNNEEFSDI